MGRKHRDALPAEVEALQAQFDDWRRQRAKGTRIPEEMRKAAGEAGRRFGISLVGRALRVGYYQLKRWAGAKAASDEPAPNPDALFVEWTPNLFRPPASEATCVVELEKKNGTRLRVSARDAESVDWFRMKEAFLEA